MIFEKKVMACAMLVVLSPLRPTARISDQTQNREAPTIVVQADVENAKIIYKVDGIVARPNLLAVLNSLAATKGTGARVTVLVDSRARIAEIGNIDGTLGKAGFATARFFVFNREANVMSTVEFGRTVPFAARPRWIP